MKGISSVLSCPGSTLNIHRSYNNSATALIMSPESGYWLLGSKWRHEAQLVCLCNSNTWLWGRKAQRHRGNEICFRNTKSTTKKRLGSQRRQKICKRYWPTRRKPFPNSNHHSLMHRSKSRNSGRVCNQKISTSGRGGKIPTGRSLGSPELLRE